MARPYRPPPPLVIVGKAGVQEAYEERLWSRRERDYWHRRYLHQTTEEAEKAVQSGRYRNIEAWLQRRELKHEQKEKEAQG